MSDEGEAETPNTPPKKKVKTRNCQFNKDWLENPNYNKWLANDKDVNMARCTMCKITFNVKYDGVKAVKSHSGTARHLNLEKASKMCDVMTKFFAPKDSKESHLVTMAEISKTFHCVKHGLSYLSTDCGNAKNVANLKECFQFVQQEYHQVLRHIPVRWLSLFQALDRLLLNWNAIKAYFLQQGAENCDRIIWKFVGDQEDQLSDQPTFAECYIYFVHHVLFIFQSSIKTLEQSHLVITDVYEIMSGLRDTLKRRKEDLFFGFKTNQALANFTSNLKLKFQEEAVQVYNRAIEYLEKWFDFENNVFLLFKSLNLKGRIPELNEVILIASHIGMDLQDADGDSLYEELSLLQNASPSFINQDISVAEKWCIFFKRVEVPILRNVVQMVLSIPCSNAYVERIFSIMNQLWNDDRNKLSVEMVKAELCIRSNIQLSCSEFYSSLSDKAELIKSAKSNTKYHFKF
ncbi:hat family dimerization domaincontaining protein-related [Holotrichia oblita]|uniref:Hat family dimerization domaincontaining protein-related n=1 Tax=Holotrichia oblita TaxID=644536 RepID=A0ACB9THW6_HOLOL|nr:hat family dimerization domaincontaining protein-related [Holotrichia oblita]